MRLQGGELSPGRGTALHRADRRVAIKERSTPRLMAGDRIVTGAEQAIIRWNDGSRCVLGADTEATLRTADAADALFVLLRRGELAYSFSADAPLRVGFERAGLELDAVETSIALSGYLTASVDGTRVYKPLALAGTTIVEARGDDPSASDSATDDDDAADESSSSGSTLDHPDDVNSRHRVAFSTGTSMTDQVVQAVTTDGRAKTTALGEGVPLATEPRWSPDLNRLVFQRRIGSSYDIIVQNVNRDGLGEKITVLTDTPSINETEPVWGDGWVYFVSDREGDTAIFRMTFDGKRPKRLTSPTLKATGPDQRKLSPAAGHSTDIVFSGWTGASRDLFAIDPDGDPASLRAIRETTNANEWAPRWSPDGDEIAYITDTFGANNIQVMRVATGEVHIHALLPQTAAEMMYTANLDFSWSPSGERFVVTYSSTPGGANDTLAVVNRDGAIVETLASDPTAMFLHPDWRGGVALIPVWVPADPVIIGGAVVGVAGLGVIIYELTDDDHGDDDDDDDDRRPPSSPFAP